MKALGKGSVASIVKVGLTIAWVVLWFGLFCLIGAAILYGVVTALAANGVFDSAKLNEAGISWSIVVPAALVGSVLLGGSLIIVWRLRKLFDSFTSGEPFRRENAVHLRVIWITMAAMEFARYALFAFMGLVFVSQWPESLRAEFDFGGVIDFTNWLAIGILIVLAEVFREGARLKEEQELTI